MKPEGSLPCSQLPTICPYPEPVYSSPCPPTLPTNRTLWRSSFILSSHLRLGLPGACRVLVGKPEGKSTLSFPHQHPACTSPLPHSCYMRSPSHSRFDHTKNIYGGEYKSVSCPLCNFLHSLVTSSLLGPNILLSTLFSNIVWPTVLPQCERPYSSFSLSWAPLMVVAYADC